MSKQLSLDPRIQSIFPIALAALLVVGVARLVLDDLKSHSSFVFKMYSQPNREKHRLPIVVSPKDLMDEDCNLFEGKWEWDNASYPIYEEETCPFLVKQVTCQKNGRPDSFYKKWRWQPNSCKLPRFDPLKLLDILRDKRIMFVGDSIQRGQFESMDYNVSIEYYWAPFMVESISDHATNHTVMKRMVKLDSIANHGKHWKGVDVLVFESYVWWRYKSLINATYGSPEDVKEYNVTTAYRLAMETWANWIESNINPNTQKVFFMTMSPTHLWSWEWKPGSDENCFDESQPIEHPYWGTGSSTEIMKIVHDVLQDLKIKVTLLNITQLSEFRKDAHTSIYGERRGKLLTKEQRSDPKQFADCIHWCLPGVPDTWNEILYAYLLRNHQNLL